jgi:hypothetical protein
MLGRVMPYIQREKELDRQNRLELAGRIGPRIDNQRFPEGGNGQLQNVAQAMQQPPRNDQPTYKFDLGNDASQQFAHNIVNPPERTLPYQKLAADYGLKTSQLQEKARESDYKTGFNYDKLSADTDAKSERNRISQYSAETRRQLANLHNLSDSEKLRLVQEGKVDIQHIRDAAALARISASGEQNRETEGVKNENSLGQIAARGRNSLQLKQTPGVMLPAQERTSQFNAARELYNTRPDLRPFIKIGEGNTFEVSEDAPPDKQKEISDTVFGKSKSYGNAPKNNDPLGIRQQDE